MGIENFLNSLNEKHKSQDLANEVERNQLANQEINKTKIISALDNLYSDMGNENYDSITNNFQQIKTELSSIDNETVKAKLQVIEEGIRDKEWSKFNAAMKAIREIKEILK